MKWLEKSTVGILCMWISELFIFFSDSSPFQKLLCYNDRFYTLVILVFIIAWPCPQLAYWFFPFIMWMLTQFFWNGDVYSMHFRLFDVSQLVFAIAVYALTLSLGARYQPPGVNTASNLARGVRSVWKKQVFMWGRSHSTLLGDTTDKDWLLKGHAWYYMKRVGRQLVLQPVVDTIVGH